MCVYMSIMSHFLWRCCQTSYNVCTNRTLTKLYPIFWRSSPLYDKNWDKQWRSLGGWAQWRQHICCMDDNLWWKMNFDGRQPLMEDNFWWKTTFNERWPLMEDNLWRKTTFDGIQPLMKDNLCWKTTFYGRCPLMEDKVCWKMSFDGRQPFLPLRK